MDIKERYICCMGQVRGPGRGGFGKCRMFMKCESGKSCCLGGEGRGK